MKKAIAKAVFVIAISSILFVVEYICQYVLGFTPLLFMVCFCLSESLQRSFDEFWSDLST